MKLFKRKLSVKQREALARLADGIECGAKLRPQTSKKLIGIVGWNQETDQPEYGSCALGAAWECAMIEKGVEFSLAEATQMGAIDYSSILKAYGVTTNATMKMITIEGKEIADPDASVDDVIVRLNDWLQWSRERIAQFLREIE